MRLGFGCGGRLVAAFLALGVAGSAAHAQSIKVVAAENFYGDIARQIGGPGVDVTSILANPDQDPHEFEASPATARALAKADLVVYNGADYDPWAVKLLSASPSSARKVIDVATLVGIKAGDNPHVWYDPDMAPVLARSFARTFAQLDPAHGAAYRMRLTAFEASMTPLRDQIMALRSKFAATPVTATEPVFGYMADALGLEMRNRHFQLAVMNGTEPSAADIAAFENDLVSRNVRVLIYNRQTSSALTRRMREIAQKAGVPVVGVSETEPAGKDYQEWMRSQLDAIGRALAR